jgi:FAD/FMN-containing dehydrogenase
MAADSIDPLRARVRGEIVQPSDAAYDSIRKVYNGMIDNRPGLIVRCVDAADVIATVNFARDKQMLAAVRGGGHNGAGLGTCEGGLVIDLSHMKGVHVDPAARTARVGGGCTWGDVDHATHAFGMAVPSGIISTTGVGGLTLGGGIGHLSRKYGLTIDNLLAVDLVLADGRFVTASEKENQDLFWAVRGGGGNFGVATSFLFRLHPVETVYAGPTFWPLDQADDVMRRYREFIVEAPGDVNGFFAFLVVPPAPTFPEHLHNRKMCGIVWCCTGPAAKAEQAIEPMLRFGEPALSMVGSMPFPMLQSMFDALYTPGMQWYWKADFVKELSDPAVSLHIEHASRIPTMFSTMHLYPINGAVHRVGAGDTAFSCRDATWAEVIVGVDPDPANAEKIIDWTRSYWDALHPYSAGSAYVNFMMEEGPDRIRATYGQNYGRLAAIKRKYDPANFFRVNQNIQPAAASATG